MDSYNALFEVVLLANPLSYISAEYPVLISNKLNQSVSIDVRSCGLGLNISYTAGFLYSYD